MMPGSLNRSLVMPLTAAALDQATRSLFDHARRIVAWGSGSVFDYFNGLYPVPLAYIVDNDATRWGQTRHGIEIVSPERLRDERGDTFVIIYSSAWPEIQQQIARISGLASLPASAVFADARTRARLAWSETLAAQPVSYRAPASTNAIVVQGPVVPAITSQVLRITAALHPHDRIVLSTWKTTDPELLYEAGAIADDVVLNTLPANPGIQNRNLQIVSTRGGIVRAMEHGARTILKTRTDLAVLADPVFERAAWWLDRVQDGRARAAGLRRRLLVPSSYTRRFLLYHPSDLVMLGAADDMLRYWNAPLDNRSGSLLGPEWIDQSLTSVNLAGNPSESYLGLQFCRALGRPVAGTLEDSWRFYRDLFAVVDDEWLDLLWFKNLSIPDAAAREGVRQPVTQAFWERLHAGDASLLADASGVDPDQIALRALAGAA